MLHTVQCCGSGIRYFLDPWIRDEFFLDPESQPHIFLVKNAKILPQKQNIYNFEKFMATKKGSTTNSPYTFLFLLDPG